jgi:hypothetical protein
MSLNSFSLSIKLSLSLLIHQNRLYSLDIARVPGHLEGEILGNDRFEIRIDAVELEPCGDEKEFMSV